MHRRPTEQQLSCRALRTKIGNYDEALKQYLRALELRRSAGDKRGAAIESYSLGTVFEQQGRYDAAIKSKEEALNGFRELRDRSFWLGEILGGYGHALGQSGRNGEAEKVLTEALDVAREIRSQAVIAQGRQSEPGLLGEVLNEEWHSCLVGQSEKDDPVGWREDRLRRDGGERGRCRQQQGP
jgi:tetratricopeptide (TPR) repeat protein